MSSIGSNFFYSIMEFFPLSIGRAGARKPRRLILLSSVGGLPPGWPPSGAGLARWTRVSYSRRTRPRLTPHRGCASAECYVTPFDTRLRDHPYAAVGGQRSRPGHGPHAGEQFPGHSHHDRMRMFAAWAQWPVPFTQAHLRLPADRLERLRHLLQARPWGWRRTFAGYR
jgi:hypothetical protein